MNKGDTVYFLSEYKWYKGRVATTPRANSKTVMVTYCPWGTDINTRVKLEKVAMPDELVCVVWELWKNQNSYRVERKLYKETRIRASSVSRDHIGPNGRIDENVKPELENL